MESEGLSRTACICSGVSAALGNWHGVWSRSSPITQPPPPHSSKSPGGKCFVKLCRDSPGDPHARLGIKALNYLPVEKTHLPAIGQRGTGFHLQAPYIRKENISVITKVSNMFIMKDLKTLKGMKKEEAHVDPWQLLSPSPRHTSAVAAPDLLGQVLLPGKAQACVRM